MSLISFSVLPRNCSIAILVMTMKLMVAMMTMKEDAHIRKGSSLITFTLATPATVTGTPWMMMMIMTHGIDYDDDIDDEDGFIFLI